MEASGRKCIQWENRFQWYYIYAIDCGDRENETASGVYDEKPNLNDVTTGYDVGDSENKTIIDVNDEKTDSNDVTSAYDDGESKNETASGVCKVKKEYDAEPRLDEADSVSVDDKSTSKKIGTQENSYVQEITKPDKILADVVKTKDTDANVTIILGHYAPLILAPAEDL